MLKKYIAVLILAFSPVVQATELFEDKQLQLTVEVLSENKIQSKLLIREAGLTLKLPKRWNLSSPNFVIEQKGLAEITDQIFERLNIPDKQYDFIAKGLAPRKTKKHIRIFSTRKSEWFDTTQRISYDDLVSYASVSLYLLDIPDTEKTAKSLYQSAAESIKDDTKATISSKLQKLKINGMSCFHFRVHEYMQTSYYFMQIENRTLLMIFENMRATTEEHLKDMDRLLSRIQKK